MKSYLNKLHLVFIIIVRFVAVCKAFKNDFNDFYTINNVDETLNNIIVEPEHLYYDGIQDSGRHKRFATNSNFSNIKQKVHDALFSPDIVALKIDEWVLLLEENTFLSFGKHFEEEWVSNEKDTNKRGKDVNCKFYSGTILYEADSKAIVTECEKSYYGYFISQGIPYLIEPIIIPEGGHIVYKAIKPQNDLVQESKLKFNEEFASDNSINEMDSDINVFAEHFNEIQGIDGTGKKQFENKKGIQIDKYGSFYLEDNLDNNEDALRRKKRSSHNEHKGVFNLTGDTILDDVNFDFSDEVIEEPEKTVLKDTIENNSYDDYDKDLPPRKVHWHKKHDEEEEVGYFVDTAWETRPFPKKSGSSSGPKPQEERWLEIALAVDYTVIEFHGKSRIRQYIMALMNIVSAIYKDPSLDANLNLVMARLIFYDDKKDSMIKEGDAKKSLESVNRWNHRLIGRLPFDENPHDVAVWLTREFLGGPSGYAPVAGACDRSRSTALNKDEGLASAFIIAHEMAHILGLTHDGDTKAGNKCDDEVMKGTIMAPTVTANFNRFAWSSCSKEEFHRLIHQWTCLKNPPKGKNHTILQPGTTVSFTMDEQCRMEYGDGYTLCKTFELIEPCTHLWCGHKNSSLYCITKKGAPVEGTQCGFDKWCVDGYCQRVDGRLTGLGRGVSGSSDVPKAGGWGQWSEWSKCSRPCGYGVKIRRRACDNPAPAWGGADCQGPSEEKEVCRQSRWCWEGPSLDSRAERCALLPREGRGDGAWLPYDSEEEGLMCKVSCLLWDTGEVLRSGEHLPDGTSCSYENHHHICIEGSCKKLGCDGLENSTLVEDRCGICDGRGDTCFDNQLVFNKTLKKDLTRLVVLPRHSRLITLRVTLHSSIESNQIVAYSFFHLVLRDRHKRLFRLVARNADDMELQSSQQSVDFTSPVWAGYQEGPSVVLAGSAIIAGRPPRMLTLSSKGPLHSDVVVMLASPPEYLHTVETTVEVNYTLGLEDGNRYQWVSEGQTPCHCGKPLKSVPLRCIDTRRGNRTVHHSHCPKTSKPSLKVESCSMSCDFHWIPGPWEHCTATCGSAGRSHRQVYCVPLTIGHDASPRKLSTYMVEPNHCRDFKPVQDKPCNVFSCPAYWFEEPWTNCSSSCGPGISTRPLTCTATDWAACGPRPNLRWRPCRAPCVGKPRIEVNSCHKDRSPYCALPSLLRFCVIPSFGRLCCKSCHHILKIGM